MGDTLDATQRIEAAKKKADEKKVILTPEEKRQKQFKILVNQIVVNQLGPSIAQLDAIASSNGIDAAWEQVGVVVQKAVMAGLAHQAKRIQKLEKQIEELKDGKASKK